MAMSVLVKSIRREGIRRRHQGFAGRGQDSGADYRAVSAVKQPNAAAPARPAGRRRELGPAQDQATYSCSCGYVFEASVSTSVGCPHCGTAQAW
jgi:hypothetical protein